MVDANLGEAGERLSLGVAAANEQEVEEAAKSGRAKLGASSRRGAIRVMVMDMGRTCVVLKGQVVVFACGMMVWRRGGNDNYQRGTQQVFVVLR